MLPLPLDLRQQEIILELKSGKHTFEFLEKVLVKAEVGNADIINPQMYRWHFFEELFCDSKEVRAVKGKETKVVGDVEEQTIQGPEA